MTDNEWDRKYYVPHARLRREDVITDTAPKVEREPGEDEEEEIRDSEWNGGYDCDCSSEEPGREEEAVGGIEKGKEIEIGEVTTPSFSPDPIDYFPASRQEDLSVCKDEHIGCLVRAMKKPHHPATGKFSQKKRLLVSLCRELQLLNTDKPFYLGERQAAKLLGCSKNAAWKMIDSIRRKGIIKEVKKGFMKGLASEYIYMLGDI